jgi:hypothetical protein
VILLAGFPYSDSLLKKYSLIQTLMLSIYITLFGILAVMTLFALPAIITDNKGPPQQIAEASNQPLATRG